MSASPGLREGDSGERPPRAVINTLRMLLLVSRVRASMYPSGARVERDRLDLRFSGPRCAASYDLHSELDGTHRPIWLHFDKGLGNLDPFHDRSDLVGSNA